VLVDQQDDLSAMQADLAYQLESFRVQLKQLRGRIGYLYSRPVVDRDRALAAMAEVEFYKRALGKLDDPTEHEVLVSLSPVGLASRQSLPLRGPTTTLLGSLLDAYLMVLHGRHGPHGGTGGIVRRGELEAIAFSFGDTCEVHSADRIDDRRLQSLVARRPQLVVLHLAGLCIRDFFAEETGCHVWKSVSHGTEVVRVQVAPCARRDLNEVVAEHRHAVAGFAAALDEGGPLPANPESLLPVVRELHYTPGEHAEQRAELMVDDYQLGYSETVRVRTMAEVLPRLWTLRMSRQAARRDDG